jgi:GTPase SAR1 family protein
MQQVRAITPKEAFHTLDPFALVQPDDAWYLNLEQYLDLKHYPLKAKLDLHFDRPAFMQAQDYVQIGVVGHKGTGKTTQLRKYMSELETNQHILPVFVDVLSTLDQADLSFADVILILVQSVAESLKTVKGARFPKAQYELVKNWFSEELLTETHTKEILASLETTATAKGGIPFLANLMAKITATLKTDNQYRSEIRRRAERDPSELLRNANIFLDAASTAISTRQQPRTIAVVFDNLEKISKRSLVDSAVLQRADELRSLRCHLLLFLDPADQFAPKTRQVSDVFPFVLVPMLPLRERDQPLEHVDPTTLKAITALLEKRLDVNLVFDDPHACISEISRKSGGRLRHILALTRRACENAFSGKVSLQDVQYASESLTSERVTAVKPLQWSRLAEIHRDKQIANDSDDAHLLLHSLVLNYNGKQWFDIHPLVSLDKRFHEAWQKIKP